MPANPAWYPLMNGEEELEEVLTAIRKSSLKQGPFDFLRFKLPLQSLASCMIPCGAPKGMKVGTGAKLFRSNDTGVRALVGSPVRSNLWELLAASGAPGMLGSMLNRIRKGYPR
jgi:hypothetical protein